MRTDVAPNLLPFDPADRPGVAKGGVSSTLSALDRSGVVYRPAEPRDSLPAVTAPVMDLPGLKPSAGRAGGDLATQSARVEKQARQLVSQTFFGTLLKQMRDSPFKSDLFEGGRGGQAFSGMFDQKLIDQMSRGAGNKLVNAVVRKFDARRAYAGQHVGSRTPERPATRQDPGAIGNRSTGPTDALNRGTAPAAADRDATNPYRNIKIHVDPALRA